MKYPPGFTFDPSEKVLIGYYLFKRLSGELTADEKAVVRDYNLYGYEEPWEIWRRFAGSGSVSTRDLFFFTPLRKKTVNGSNIIRTVGSSGGTWHGVDSSTPIHDEGETNYLLGFRRKFSYKNPSSSQNGCWIMHEYSLNLVGRSNNLVLCRLRNNQLTAWGGRKNKRNEECIEEGVRREAQVIDGETTNLAEPVLAVAPAAVEPFVLRLPAAVEPVVLGPAADSTPDSMNQSVADTDEAYPEKNCEDADWFDSWLLS
ncbi:hypothetical protein K2173_022216 [Erythroxylum novogranatense]|uniref:NAC domain-containing protein n=1 Tax=Erythroxylum novogranatense TaxID=1862640 RepID=A0AAV8STL3_9ROSI|nr:hypothetical protein K2173_022216 [Erythroxylum novogranatense]